MRNTWGANSRNGGKNSIFTVRRKDKERSVLLSGDPGIHNVPNSLVPKFYVVYLVSDKEF